MSHRWRVYAKGAIYKGECVAGCANLDDALTLVIAHGDGSTVRDSHLAGAIVWREGERKASVAQRRTIISNRTKA